MRVTFINLRVADIFIFVRVAVLSVIILLLVLLNTIIITLNLFRSLLGALLELHAVGLEHDVFVFQILLTVIVILVILGATRAVRAASTLLSSLLLLPSHNILLAVQPRLLHINRLLLLLSQTRFVHFLHCR